MTSIEPKIACSQISVPHIGLLLFGVGWAGKKSAYGSQRKLKFKVSIASTVIGGIVSLYEGATEIIVQPERTFIGIYSWSTICRRIGVRGNTSGFIDFCRRGSCV